MSSPLVDRLFAFLLKVGGLKIIHCGFSQNTTLLLQSYIGLHKSHHCHCLQAFYLHLPLMMTPKKESQN